MKKKRPSYAVSALHSAAYFVRGSYISIVVQLPILHPIRNQTNGGARPEAHSAASILHCSQFFAAFATVFGVIHGFIEFVLQPISRYVQSALDRVNRLSILIAVHSSTFALSQLRFKKSKIHVRAAGFSSNIECEHDQPVDDS